jgi:predicted PurR-regulated permease PerM
VEGSRARLTEGAVDARSLYRAVLLAGGLLVLGLLFEQLVTFLVAIFMTVLIAIPLAATADRLERFHVPRPIGALIGLLIGFGAIALILFLVIPPLVDQTKQFVDQVPSIIDDLSAKIGRATGSGPDALGNRVQDFLEGFSEHPEDLLGPLASIGLGVASGLAALVLMTITAYYIAVRPEPLVDGMLSLFPPPRREWAAGVMERLRESWIGWLQGVLVDMLVTGTLLWAGLTLIGLDFALVFAVLSALLVVIPYFGSIAGAVPPTLFALTDSPEKALLALGVYILVQQIEGNVIIPLVMAQRVKLHPALIAIGVVVVGRLFGYLGLFVAVPLISMAVILADELWVKRTDEKHGVRPVTSGEAIDHQTAAAERERMPGVGPPAPGPIQPESEPGPPGGVSVPGWRE